MLVGRFLMIVPGARDRRDPGRQEVGAAGPGTFPTNGPLFAALLVGVILIVGALTFFPALAWARSSSTS